MFSCRNVVFRSGLAVLMKPQSDSVTASVNASNGEQRRTFWLALMLVALAVVVAFSNGLNGAFVFDDEPTIVNNRSIRELRNMAEIFSPPVDATTWGRPLANATLALNYAMSGLDPWGYHVFNILIHALAAATLFGVVRRVSQLPTLQGRFAEHGLWLALATAVLWAVHPLQTEAVTYVVQRVESLAGLFYLLTVYCFVRSVRSPCGVRWQVASVVACFLGAGCKEIVVSAPLLVLLCDRTWIAGSFREAIRRRAWFYVGLAASWVVLLVVVSGAENRSGTAGFGTASSWLYLLTQGRAIVHYLRLVVWPAPLVFDYGNVLVVGLASVWLQAIVLVVLASAAVVAIWRRSSWGVIGFWLFAILAPSSSVVPVATQTMAEHRMYLPLAAVVVAAVLASYRWFGRWTLYVCAVVCLVWSGMTVRRNHDYLTKVSLWADTIEKRPENWRARNNLALALAEAGRPSEAAEQYEVILVQVQGSAEVRNNYANALLALGRPQEALREIDLALGAAPLVAELIDTRGLVLAALRRTQEAEVCYREALRLKPGLSDAQVHLRQLLGR